MSIISTVGFMVVLMSALLGFALCTGCAVYGALKLRKLLLRGAETTERELTDGHAFREVMRITTTGDEQ